MSKLTLFFALLSGVSIGSPLYGKVFNCDMANMTSLTGKTSLIGAPIEEPFRSEYIKKAEMDRIEVKITRERIPLLAEPVKLKNVISMTPEMPSVLLKDEADIFAPPKLSHPPLEGVVVGELITYFKGARLESYPLQTSYLFSPVAAESADLALWIKRPEKMKYEGQANMFFAIVEQAAYVGSYKVPCTEASP